MCNFGNAENDRRKLKREHHCKYQLKSSNSKVNKSFSLAAFSQSLNELTELTAKQLYKSNLN